MNEKEIKELQVACAIAGFHFELEQLDMLVSLQELVKSKGGDLTMSEVIDVKFQAKERANVKHRKEALDKFSEKV